MDTWLSIVIVSWNVVPLLRQCLASIESAPRVARGADGALRLPEGALQLVVVDNASADGTTEMLQREFPWVEVIANDVNLGFTAGNNLGLARSRGRYVLLLNPDTRLTQDDNADPLGAMSSYMEAHPRVGVLGPRLVYGDGSPQPSRRRFPTLMMALMESTLLEEWFPGNRWARAYRLADQPDDEVQTVDWVTGAAMWVRREVLEQVGGLDERFFMYSEELDWCRRIKVAGWDVVYLPAATIIHYEGQSSGQVVAARHIHFETSKVLYFRKHHGVWRAELLRAFLLATYVYRLAEESIKGLVGHKRALRRARVAAYRQVLASRLLPAGNWREDVR